MFTGIIIFHLHLERNSTKYLVAILENIEKYGKYCRILQIVEIYYLAEIKLQS
jgi:hypothetical protein